MDIKKMLESRSLIYVTLCGLILYNCRNENIFQISDTAYEEYRYVLDEYYLDEDIFEGPTVYFRENDVLYEWKYKGYDSIPVTIDVFITKYFDYQEDQSLLRTDSNEDHIKFMDLHSNYRSQ